MECREVIGVFLVYFTVLTLSVGSTSFYADNGLQQTVVVSRMPGRERREMQQEILTLLGLHHRPKPNSLGTELSAPKYMLDIYRSLQQEDEDVHFHTSPNASVNDVPEINTSDVIMSFVNHAGKINFLRHERDKTFYFDFSEVSPQESATGAQLRLYKSRSDKLLGRRQCRIEVYRIRQGRDPEDKYLESECNRTVSTELEGWIAIDVTRAADSWTVFPQTNLGLFYKVTCENGKEVDPGRFGIVGRKGAEEKQAFMVGFFRAALELHMRRTRAARRRQNSEVTYNDEADASWGWGQYHSRYSRKACQRRSLFVSFKDLGWQDWIIAPEGYAAFYCQGECSFPLGAHMNATNHAIVQTLVHLMNPAKVPKPCCAPTKLSAISVLYFDDNSNVILKKYRNMAVKACGCH